MTTAEVETKDSWPISLSWEEWHFVLIVLGFRAQQLEDRGDDSLETHLVLGKIASQIDAYREVDEDEAIRQTEGNDKG